jgi:hypothetical protein
VSTSIQAWLDRQLRNAAASLFIRGCGFAGIAPGLREAARWNRGEGMALAAAWARWPRSKSLPHFIGARGDLQAAWNARETGRIAGIIEGVINRKLNEMAAS